MDTPPTTRDRLLAHLRRLSLSVPEALRPEHDDLLRAVNRGEDFGPPKADEDEGEAVDDREDEGAPPAS